MSAAHKKHWILRIVLLFAAAYIVGLLAGRLHAKVTREPSETNLPTEQTQETETDTQSSDNRAGESRDSQNSGSRAGGSRDSQNSGSRTEDTQVSGIESGGIVQEPKKIAITFDDGPNPYYTRTLLEGLKKRGVKATFFVLGSEVEKFPDILADVYADGHLIGVHSYEHVNFGEIGDEAAQKQIEQTQEAIHAVTGEYTGFIRPPYGCWKDSLDDKVNLIEVLWDVDPLDWATADADTVARRILKDTEEGSIILLHDASESSVQAALTVIDALAGQGYEFVTVEELLLE